MTSIELKTLLGKINSDESKDMDEKINLMLSLRGQYAVEEEHTRLVKVVSAAPEGPERDGLLGLLLHEGIGVPVDLDKSFDHAEKAAKGGDALGYFLLGFMCENAETPDQAEGGPRQK